MIHLLHLLSAYSYYNTLHLRRLHHLTKIQMLLLQHLLELSNSNIYRLLVDNSHLRQNMHDIVVHARCTPKNY